jgi:hypothetical protein
MQPPRDATRTRPWFRPVALIVSGVLLALANGCKPSVPSPAPAVRRASAAVEATTAFQPVPIGAPITEPPWIAHVNAVDLDRDGLLDAVACEAREDKIVWIRQTARGEWQERVLASGIAVKAPVHVEPADMDGDGDTDLLISVMGYVFPNNDRIGAVTVLENDGRQQFTPRTLLQNIARVTDVRAADFNRDGRMDLAVAQFGYDQGEVRWMEQTAPWEFKSHGLLDLSGAINVGIADFNGDTWPDIVVLISQQWEEIHYFENNGAGGFTGRRIWGSTNEDYGSSGISVCDLNRDGRPDVLYTNGDGFGPSALPGPRPWHGVQWLENTGNGYFRFQRIADLPSAYSPLGVDLDQDGAMDIVATSAYADWDRKNPLAVSLMWYRNDGRMQFTPHVLARTPKDLITVAAGDFDGSGKPTLVTGGFYVSAPYGRMGRVTWWRRAPTAP